MKFTYRTSQNNINFLDLNDGGIFTDPYIKSTDCHQFLHYKSSHPRHIKNSILYSQTLRISKLYSSQNDFSAHISNLKDWFLARDYPLKIVCKQIDKAVFCKQPSRKDTSEQGVPFVATYHPKLKDLGKFIKNLQLFLYSDSDVRKGSSPAPVIPFEVFGR